MPYPTAPRKRLNSYCRSRRIHGVQPSFVSITPLVAPFTPLSPAYHPNNTDEAPLNIPHRSKPRRAATHLPSRRTGCNFHLPALAPPLRCTHRYIPPLSQPFPPPPPIFLKNPAFRQSPHPRWITLCLAAPRTARVSHYLPHVIPSPMCTCI